jgi:hypothetical protein
LLIYPANLLLFVIIGIFYFLSLDKFLRFLDWYGGARNKDVTGYVLWVAGLDWYGGARIKDVTGYGLRVMGCGSGFVWRSKDKGAKNKDSI